MTIIRLSNGNLFIHSPCEIDEHTKVAIEKLGEVEFIVAPGSYHYFYVSSAQSAFPNAETYICPGIERMVPEIGFWETDQMKGGEMTSSKFLSGGISTSGKSLFTTT